MLDIINTLSMWASQWLGRAADFLPVGYAFGAGMVASVNPCGFAMLPAYLGLYMGTVNETVKDQFARLSPARRTFQALSVAAAVSAGFVVLFGIAGLLIAAGGTFIVGAFPWIGFAVGFMLVAAGLWLLAGRDLTTTLGRGLAVRLNARAQGGQGRFFVFGLAYGTASLSCTLPIFLAVVGSAIAVQGIAAAAGQFISYALGMGLVVVALTLGMAFFKQSVASSLRRLLPHFHRLSAALMILAGAYIIYYWLIEGQLAQRLF
jgi:cytochrome c-type biogenesis protein